MATPGPVPKDTARADMQQAAVPALAWFGKLPAAGDFVSRRMPYPVQQFWDRWCAQGMEALKASSAVTGLQVWGHTPTWAFAVPAQPGVPGAQFGVFAPSCDRVGRIFPFVVATPILPERQAVFLKQAASLGLAWGDVVNRAQHARLGLDELDAGLHVALDETMTTGPEEGGDEGVTLPLGLDAPLLPWPDFNHEFDPQGAKSYWWSVPPPGTGHQTRVLDGTLRTAHFLELCR